MVIRRAWRGGTVPVRYIFQADAKQAKEEKETDESLNGLEDPVGSR
jgi:hypothetical protein